MPVKPIPDGYHSITPYLIVKGAAAALDFYKRALGAVELFRMDGPDGKIGHSEIKIGNSIVMVADEQPGSEYMAPTRPGGAGVGLMIYVPDVDAQFAKAAAAGAKVTRPVQDQFYGDRSGSFTDPFGHCWTISTHKEDLTPEEVAKRAQEWMAKQGKK